MTSTTRLRAIAGRTSSQTPYVCLRCRRQVSTAVRRAPSRVQTACPPHRSASSTSFEERMRKKIWGTDTPPGLANPYGAPGAFEQLRKKRWGKKNKEGPTDEENPGESAMIEQPEGEPDLDTNNFEGIRVVGQANYGLKEWDEEHQFEGLEVTVIERMRLLIVGSRYMENTRAQDRDMIVSIIHRALVEVMTLKKANLPLLVRRDAYEYSDDYDSAEEYERYKYRIAQGATFGQSDDGEMTIKLEDEELERTILERIVPIEAAPVEDIRLIEDTPEKEYVDEEQVEEEEEEEEKNASSTVEQEEEKNASSTVEQEDLEEVKNASSTVEQEDQELETVDEAETLDDLIEEEPQDEPPNEHPTAYLPADDSWRSLSLADPEFKFAVIKRVMQLTGRRIPDPDIASIKNSRGLCGHLVRKPKAKKLAETLRANQAVHLPNVELRGRRYTPIHKEEEIGRWKVIERELKARGLPVTGKGTVALEDRRVV